MSSYFKPKFKKYLKECINKLEDLGDDPMFTDQEEQESDFSFQYELERDNFAIGEEYEPK